jgi:hypothetical protein
MPLEYMHVRPIYPGIPSPYQQMPGRMPLPSTTDPSLIVAPTRHKAKEVKRRTKTGCLTCRKRRIKVSTDSFLRLLLSPLQPYPPLLRCFTVISLFRRCKGDANHPRGHAWRGHRTTCGRGKLYTELHSGLVGDRREWRLPPSPGEHLPRTTWPIRAFGRSSAVIDTATSAVTQTSQTPSRTSTALHNFSKRLHPSTPFSRLEIAASPLPSFGHGSTFPRVHLRSASLCTPHPDHAPVPCMALAADLHFTVR